MIAPVSRMSRNDSYMTVINEDGITDGSFVHVMFFLRIDTVLNWCTSGVSGTNLEKCRGIMTHDTYDA